MTSSSTAPSYSIRLTISGTNVDKYPAKQHARRVAAHLGATQGLIYLVGEKVELLRDSDQPRPFRQRRYFYYMSGVDEPDCILTYDIKTDTLTLYVPDFNLKRAIWMGPTLGLDEARQRYDVSDVKYNAYLAGDMQDYFVRNKSATYYILHKEEGPEPVFGIPDTAKRDYKTLMPAMDTCREIKDEHEIGLIRRANEISASAHSAVLHEIHRMRNESEIHGKFLSECIARGARNQAYEIIAASGENGAVLHYTKNNEPLAGRQLVCLDAGAEWNCYASDVTRTFPTEPSWPSVEASQIYSVVLRMQETCIRRIKEGIRYLDLHVLAHSIATRELLALGIFKGGSAAEIMRSGASRVFFPHGLGHHLGLEVHDVSQDSLMAFEHYDSPYEGAPPFIIDGLPPCTASSPVLKAGMVVTVEPGIYFSRVALENAKNDAVSKYIDMEVVQRYIPVGGVRIEDDILVTSQGYENLTTAPKKELEMIEAIRMGARLGL